MRTLVCLHSRHPVCEFCNLFTALAVSLYCWWEWKICLTVVAFQWKFTSAPFCFAKKKKKTGVETHHTSAGFSLGCLMAVEEGRRIDVFQIWHVGCWAGNLLLPPHLRHLTGVIPTICKELCAFFLSLSLLVPLTPCLPNIQASQPACCWEAFLFHLLNFPSSRRFLTGSYTSVPLFLLNSLPWPLCRRHERAALGCQASVCRLVDIALWCLFLHSSFFPIHNLIAAFIAASVKKLC